MSELSSALVMKHRQMREEWKEMQGIFLTLGIKKYQIPSTL